MTTIARKLRLEQTAAERRLWLVIQSFRADGWHFRRQSPIGPYVVDFVCKQARLIFEIDGDSHYVDGAVAADAARTTYLESRGYRVVRFTNLDVLTNSEGVWSEVGGCLGASKSTPLLTSP